MSPPKGDVLEFYRVDDGEYCPVCAKVLADINDCPHCGENIRESKE